MIYYFIKKESIFLDMVHIFSLDYIYHLGIDGRRAFSPFSGGTIMDYTFIRRQKMGHELREIGLVYLVVGVTTVLAILAIPTVSVLA